MDVSLFVTCLSDTFYPRSVIAMVKVLEHLGCRVDFPEAQTCCGQPLYNNGYHDDARGLARHMVEIFESSACVVSPSGSCVAMIRDYYGPLLAEDPAWRESGTALVGKTYEFVEFLQRVLEVDLAELGVRWPGRATYHFSCHLRGLGVLPNRNDVEPMLEKVADLDLAKLDRMDQCCGFGGTFAMKYPAISGTMVRDKADCIAATGATAVVSNDAGCTMNISGACHRQGQNPRFLHIAELIAEGLGLMERPQEATE